jgi:nitrite reductase/ring-hydroxylating ferredoxin subunit
LSDGVGFGHTHQPEQAARAVLSAPPILSGARPNRVCRGRDQRNFTLRAGHGPVPAGTHLTAVETVREAGSWLFTATDEYGTDEEVIVVPCEDGVAAWINRCTHEAQRFDTGRGVPMRDGEIICPKHGSMFDACSGDCDNGEAAGTTLPDVAVAVEDGEVYLTDGDYAFSHEGGIDDGDDDLSTSHVSF